MPTNNPINNLLYGPNGGLNLRGAKFVNTFQKAMALTTLDLYTAPANKRALILPCYGANANPSASSLTMIPKIKSAGLYYITGGAASTIPAVSTIQAVNKNGSYILEPGESASVTVGGTTINTFGYPIIEYDSSVRMLTSKISTFIVGNNTVYTCPANTQAFILDLNAQMASGTSLGQLSYTNNSGATVTINWFVVANGSSPVAANNVSGALSVTTLSSNFAAQTAANLAAGDTVVISSSSATAGQFAWINILEVAV